MSEITDPRITEYSKETIFGVELIVYKIAKPKQRPKYSWTIESIGGEIRDEGSDYDRPKDARDGAIEAIKEYK